MALGSLSWTGTARTTSHLLAPRPQATRASIGALVTSTTRGRRWPADAAGVPRHARRPLAQGAPAAAVTSAYSDTTSGAMSVGEIKAALLDSLFGTERGLSARSEVRAEINELISQLEAKNPTPSPTEALELLDGSWKLVYTSNSELIALLALSRLPFVTIGDITQKVEALANTVENKVQITVPLTRTALSTTASFEVRSPKRLQIRFEQGIIQTPQLLSEIDLPSELSVLGQTLDLTQVKQALEPINEQVKGLINQVSSIISQTPDLAFGIPQTPRSQTWLLTTYLDDDTRITRGDGGSVFVLVKEISLAPVTIPAQVEVLNSDDE